MILLLLPVAAFGFRLQGSPPLVAVRVEPRAALPLRARPQMVASSDKHVIEKYIVHAVTNISHLLDIPELLDGGIGLAGELLKEGRDLGITSPLSTFPEFDAELDLLQAAAHGGKLIRKKAQTWANVTSPAGALDDREQIDAAYEWSHEFFPNLNIRTRGFDPTLRADGNQVAASINNEQLNLVFCDDGAELQKLTQEVFKQGVLPMEPKAQGIWNNEWAGTREEDHKTLLQRLKKKLLPDFSRKKPKHPYECETDLNARTKWITTQYFDPIGELKPGAWAEVSQDMSLRYLGKWDVQTHGFTDEMFSQFYMASIGQSFVNGVKEDDTDADGATFVADNDWCSDAEVIEGQGKYGGKVYFDAEGNVMHIIFEKKKYHQGGKEWYYVKAKCRSTVLMLLTGMEHLLGTHLTFSNSLAMATPKLPPDHPLRRLLWPHIFNAIGVNRKAAATLSLEGGLFSRGWRLTLKGVHRAYEHVAEHWELFKFQTPRELQAKRKLGQFGKQMPLYQDGLPFFDVIRKYVGAFIDLHWETDEDVLADPHLRGFHTDLNDHLVNRDLPYFTTKGGLADVLATYIYYVTGYHTHAGTAHAEAATQGVAQSAFYKNETLDQQGSPPDAMAWTFFTYVGTASLTLPITGDTDSTEWKSGFKEKESYLWQPLPHDAAPCQDQKPVEPIGYPAAFEGKHKESRDEQAVNKQFAVDLIELQKAIMGRNQKRHKGEGYVRALSRAYNCFDVNFVESSVGI